MEPEGKRKLRVEEEFVIRAIADKLSGTWRAAENDPPDAYLILNTFTIAVEISILTQKVIDARGMTSRLSDDAPIFSIVDYLKFNISDIMPENFSISLFFTTPLYSIHKPKWLSKWRSEKC